MGKFKSHGIGYGHSELVQSQFRVTGMVRKPKPCYHNDTPSKLSDAKLAFSVMLLTVVTLGTSIYASAWLRNNLEYQETVRVQVETLGETDEL